MNKNACWIRNILLLILSALLIGCGGGGGGESSGSRGSGNDTSGLSVSSAESMSHFLDELTPYVDEETLNGWRTYNSSIQEARYDDIYSAIRSNFLIAGGYYHFGQQDYPARNAQFSLKPQNRYVMDFEGLDMTNNLEGSGELRAFIGFKFKSEPEYTGARLPKIYSPSELSNKPLDVLVVANTIARDDQGDFYEDIKVWEGVFYPPGQKGAMQWGDVFEGKYTQIGLEFAEGRSAPGYTLPSILNEYAARWERYNKIDVSDNDNNDVLSDTFGPEINPDSIKSGVYQGIVVLDLSNATGNFNFESSVVRLFVNSDGEIIGDNCVGKIESNGFTRMDCSQNLGYGDFYLTGNIKPTEHRLAISGTVSVDTYGTGTFKEVPAELSVNKEPDEGDFPLQNYAGTWVISSNLSLGRWPSRQYLIEIDQNGNITNSAQDTRCQVNGKLSINNQNENSISLSLNTAYRQIFAFAQQTNNEPICDPERANTTEVYEFGADTTHMRAGLYPIAFDGLASPDNLVFAKHQAPINYDGGIYYKEKPNSVYRIIMYRPPKI